MRFFVFSSLFLSFLIVQRAYAYSCIIDDQINVIEISLQSDVIFVGENIDVQTDHSEKYLYKIIEPLKGVPDGVSSLVSNRPLVVGDHFGHANFPVKFIQKTSKIGNRTHTYMEPQRWLFLAHYKENLELFPTLYHCKDVPPADAIISFLKGPYRYRYFILGFMLLLVFSVWRVGGVERFLTADLKSLSGAIFLNTPLEIKSDKTYFGKICIPVLFLGCFIFIIFLDRYLRYYNFF